MYEENDRKECRDTQDNKVYHPLREYQKYIPDLEIAPCSDIANNKYWAWFMKTYQNELVEYYNKRRMAVSLPDIPKSWEQINQQAAIDSLDTL